MLCSRCAVATPSGWISGGLRRLLDRHTERDSRLSLERSSQLVVATERAISTVSIRIASNTCNAITNLTLRDITASLVGP